MILLLLWCILLSAGFDADALSYDYSATIECLASPRKPHYDGGIIQNPEFNDRLTGWTKFGSPTIEHRELNGNRFIVAKSRSQSFDSASQKLYLRKDRLYTFSAWIQLSEGSSPVTAVVKTSSGFKRVGATFAESRCWSMLKGGFTANATGPAQLYFESNSTAELWMDNVSLQPFTKKEWKSHQDESIEKVRKTKVRIQVVNKQGNALSNATISIEQTNAGFQFGCAINKNILTNTSYQNWYTSRRFKVTTFEDEMKWYTTEPSQGHVDYSAADALLKFAKQHNLAVRGHNVFWNDGRFQPAGWVSSLSSPNLYNAAKARIFSIMSRYKGQVISWDVVNENLHFNFFETRLGPSASGTLYNFAHAADGGATLFMNEFNTIEDGTDPASTPAKYLEKLRSILKYPGNSNLRMGIGLESHFHWLDLAYMRSALDTLAAANYPIWLTEVDVSSGPNQAQFLEQILREGHSHPKVAGIVVWAAWKPSGCYAMCLTDNNFRNLPTGNVVDKLLGEWGVLSPLIANTDENGFYETSLFHGDYNVTIQHTSSLSSSLSQSLKVLPADDAPSTLFLYLTA